MPPKQITAEKLFDCNDLSAFIASIVQVLPYEGVSRSHFYACEVNKIRFLTKLGFYHKSPAEIYGKRKGATRHNIDAEIGILRALKKAITDRGVSPCILELVHWKVCSRVDRMIRLSSCDTLREVGAKNVGDRLRESLCEHHDLVKAGLAHNKCAFLVLDRCDMTLGEYLSKGLNTAVSLAVFKSILFQIVYTVYAISLVYPRFRHGDLHIENIMLKFDMDYAFSANQPRYLRFRTALGTFSVPYFGIIAKIIDFGHSSLPEERIVSDAINDKLHVFYRADNDLLLLFHWISVSLMRYSADKSGRANALLAELEPEKLYSKFNTDFIRRHDQLVPSYDDMMQSNAWNEYRNSAPDPYVYADYEAMSRGKK